MFTDLINAISSFMLDLWYLWIFLMMVLESSFFPFPSEVAMIPAGYWVWKWVMNFWLVFIVWISWALVWATINYFIAYLLWEKVILKLIKKYWKYFLISEESYSKTKKYFIENGSLATFTWRLVPVVRQLISIPAWIFKMDFNKFLIFTFIWAWIWNIILITIWLIIWWTIWDVSDVAKILDRPDVADYLTKFTYWWLSFVIIIILTYFFVKKKRKK